MAKKYTAKDITVLEGLEPVRKRPAMYIGGTGTDGYHHLLTEIVDNSVDEAMNGHASTITVSISKDRRTATVTDDGRGIPVGMRPKAGKSALTVILTTLHAGGKFEAGNYIHSGGLHGVGASVVNALSSKLEVRVRREGHEHAQTFKRGKAASKVSKKKNSGKTGTTISFTPDTDIFGKRLRYDIDRVRKNLDDKSFVHSGVRFIFIDEETGKEERFLQRKGLAALMRRAIKLQKIHNVLTNGDGKGGAIFEFKRDFKDEALGRIHIVLTWTDATDDKRIRSYVNGVHTSAHGTHVNGFRSAVVKAVRSYLDTHTKLVAKNVKIATEDIREGLMGIVSIFMAEPQFQGQTKARLNNPEASSAVESALWLAIEQWLNDNKSLAEAVIARIASAARARQASRFAAEASRKKGKSRRRANLPDKLADCSSSNADDCELFIVEGDSAGGSAKQGRNPKIQAVLPLRGKVLNVQQASLKKLLDNRELSDIIKALGCGIGDTLDLSKLNYNKVILLMDADADGDHITTLLLTFFFKHMRNLISAGHLYVARPPLFKLEFGKKSVYWAANEKERDKLLKKHHKKPVPRISRFKGLGEMMPAVLRDTTLKPGLRTLQRVKVVNAYTTESNLEQLMGKKSDQRFLFIMEEAEKLMEIDV